MTTRRPSTGALTGSDRQRLVPLRGRITRYMASCCIARLLVLAAENRRQPIVIHIDSPGGLANETFQIISTIEGIKSPVGTFCHGEVGGTAVMIAAHGIRGFRVAMADTVFSFKHFDRDTRQQGLVKPDHFEKLLAENLSRDVQKSEAEVIEWFRQGSEFSAQEAVQAGLIDLISTVPSPPPQSPLTPLQK